VLGTALPSRDVPVVRHARDLFEDTRDVLAPADRNTVSTLWKNA